MVGLFQCVVVVVVVAAKLLGRVKSQDNMRPGDSLRWPGGLVTFHLDPNLTEAAVASVRRVVERLETITCLRFVPLAARQTTSSPGGPKKVLYIRPGRSCFYEKFGHERPGSILLKINNKCSEQTGSLLHVFLHVLGVRHEHQRYDRNYYVTINHHNIQLAHINEFIRRSWGVSYVASAGLPYDYTSVMHHKPNAFAIDPKQPVIQPIVPCAKAIMGQQTFMSRSDVARLNRLYACEQHYLGNGIVGAVPYYTWRRRAARLHRREDSQRW